MTEEKHETEGKKRKSKSRETFEAILIAVTVALFLRAFVVEAFKIPSSSMVPTLKIGDHIFVNKYIYGLRIPFTKNPPKQLVEFKTPRRGEIVIFNFPKDTSKDYIKRLIALPGDKIKIVDDKVFVNGNLLEKKKLESLDERDILQDIPNNEKYDLFREKSLDGISYYTMYRKERSWGFSYYDCMFCENPDGSEIIVPEDHYFVMGDNRDNSADSRRWGFVPEEYVKGRALFTWLSLNSDEPIFWKIPGIRWERFGRLIK